MSRKRTANEILKYIEEAYDKSWLASTDSSSDPEIEMKRLDAMYCIMNAYPDIPDRGYTVWECGYLSGVLGALRWVMGEEREFTDI